VEPRRRQIIRAVALDPGIRTFHGTYDTEGRFGQIGDDQIGRIVGVAKRADRIRSRIDRVCQLINEGTYRDNDKRKEKRKRARKRIREKGIKCRDLRSDAHWKVARALCQRYDHVMIPKFHCMAMMKFRTHRQRHGSVGSSCRVRWRTR
jgi:putative transposase